MTSHPDLGESYQTLRRRLTDFNEEVHDMLKEISREKKTAIYLDTSTPFYSFVQLFSQLNEDLDYFFESVAHAQYAHEAVARALKAINGQLEQFIKDAGEDFQQQKINNLPVSDIVHFNRLDKKIGEINNIRDEISLILAQHEKLPQFSEIKPASANTRWEACALLEEVVLGRFTAIEKRLALLEKKMGVEEFSFTDNRRPLGIVTVTHRECEKHFSAMQNAKYEERTAKEYLNKIVSALDNMFQELMLRDYALRLEFSAHQPSLEQYEYCLNTLNELRGTRKEVAAILASGRTGEAAAYVLPRTVRTLPAIVSHFKEKTLDEINCIISMMDQMKFYLPESARSSTGMFGAAYKAMQEMQRPVQKAFSTAEMYAGRLQNQEMHNELREASTWLKAKLQFVKLKLQNLKEASKEIAARQHVGNLTVPFQQIEQKMKSVEEGSRNLAEYLDMPRARKEGLSL